MAFDIRNHLKKTKTTKPRHPFIGSGNHVLALLGFRYSESRDDGPIYGCDFVVVKSDAADHPVGSVRSQIFKVERRPKFQSQDSDADRLVALIQNMLGCTEQTVDSVKLSALEVAQIESGKLLDEAGLAAAKGRGLLVGAYGAPAKKTSAGKDFVDVSWSHVPGQTPESIAAKRRELDISHPRAAADAPATGGSLLPT